jgi:hypothetical protein
MIQEWSYVPDSPPTGYVLRKRLGWDPSLEFHSNHGTSFWVFEPGDGGPSKRIQLSP